MVSPIYAVRVNPAMANPIQQGLKRDLTATLVLHANARNG